jgi:hypothetical protein
VPSAAGGSSSTFFLPQPATSAVDASNMAAILIVFVFMVFSFGLPASV